MSDKQPITLVNHVRNLLYLGDELLVKENPTIWLPTALRALGYDVQIIDVRWEDMPRDDRGHVQEFHSLASLKNHLDAVRANERRSSIDYHRSELTRLLAEDRRCHSKARNTDT